MTDKPDYMQKARKQLETDATAQPLSIGAVIHLRNALEALDTERAAHEATKAELQALRERAGEVVSIASHELHACLGMLHGEDAKDVARAHAECRDFLRSLLPAPEPDPLVMYVARAISIRATELDAEAPDTCGRLQFIVNRDYLLAEAAIKELTRHGLTIAAIGGKHD